MFDESEDREIGSGGIGVSEAPFDDTTHKPQSGAATIARSFTAIPLYLADLPVKPLRHRLGIPRHPEAGNLQAQLIRFLTGKYQLRGGSKEDRLSAREWISIFYHNVVVHEG